MPDREEFHARHPHPAARDEFHARHPHPAARDEFHARHPHPAARDFDVFYRGTAQRLMRYAYGLTTDAAEAQDLVQEAYARAWQRWHRLRRYEDPEAWLRLVVTRLATDWWRRTRVRREVAAAQRPPAPTPPPDENGLLLVAALRTLPPAQRRALTLHYLLDKSVMQIADEVGVSAGTVKSWLSRGRTALAAALADVISAPAPANGPADPQTPTGGWNA